MYYDRGRHVENFGGSSSWLQIKSWTTAMLVVLADLGRPLGLPGRLSVVP